MTTTIPKQTTTTIKNNIKKLDFLNKKMVDIVFVNDEKVSPEIVSLVKQARILPRSAFTNI